MSEEKDPNTQDGAEIAAATPAAEPAPQETPATAETKPAAATKSADSDAAAPAQPEAAKEEGHASRKEDPRNKDIFLQIEGAQEEKVKIVKAKGSKNVHTGIVHIQATFNNTKVSVTDLRGNALGWSSAGKLGFKGSRKSTAYAAQLVSQDACRQAMGHGLKEAEVRVKGPGAGRESAVRAVQAIGIDITTIKDVTPIPHNGCRPPKARRV